MTKFIPSKVELREGDTISMRDHQGVLWSGVVTKNLTAILREVMPHEEAARRK